MQLRANEELLLQAFRRLPKATAVELSALAERLAALSVGANVDWSESWTEADLQDYTNASLNRIDIEEQEPR